jgi:hydroxymethylbilane synthase
LWQAHAVASAVAERGGPACRIVVIKTSGDALADRPLSEAGGKRLFVKEIEDALLRNDVDLAVHSSKDMPAALPAGLTIAGVLPREDPLDAVVLPANVRLAPQAAGGPTGPASDNGRAPTIDDLTRLLGASPNIGTASVRRVAQLSHVFAGARFGPIRGNLDTRLRKLDSGDHDALVLAAAGLRRLGMATRITMTLPVDACVPAPGQGIVAIEVRADDARVRQIVRGIDDADAGVALETERALVEALGGGCQTPIGALASPVDGESILIVAAVAALDGSRIIRASASGPRREAAALGARAGRQLLAQGADVILAEAQTRA